MPSAKIIAEIFTIRPIDILNKSISLPKFDGTNE
jgi:hypothetical protein